MATDASGVQSHCEDGERPWPCERRRQRRRSGVASTPRSRPRHLRRVQTAHGYWVAVPRARDLTPPSRALRSGSAQAAIAAWPGALLSSEAGGRLPGSPGVGRTQLLVAVGLKASAPRHPHGFPPRGPPARGRATLKSYRIRQNHSVTAHALCHALLVRSKLPSPGTLGGSLIEGHDS